MKNRSLIIVSIVLAIAIFLSVADAFWWNVVFNKSDISLESFFLLLAFGAAYYYAYITSEILQVNKNPVLRLQWHDIGATEQQPFKTYRDEMVLGTDRADTFNKLYNSFTNLQLVNDGNGSVKDLIIETSYLNQGKVIKQIKRVTAIGSRLYTQLKYMDPPERNRHMVFNSEVMSYKNPFRIVVKYSDFKDNVDTICFISDERYNDGFRIEKKK